MSVSVSALYAARAAAGEIELDAAQQEVAERLANLNARLATYRLARKSSSLGWLFGERERAGPPLRGLYIYGDVGRGKTMLMDLFFAACPVLRRRRSHFHEFMANVHDRIHEYRLKIKRSEIADQDPIKLVAADIAAESWVLCFDEFHVDDIADAMILGRLFAQLFEHGVVVVATSNVAPDDLYRDGLNQALFLPFIALLKDRLDILELDASMDYRLNRLAGEPVYHVASGAQAHALLDRAWDQLTDEAVPAPYELDVQGREFIVARSAKGVARFSFDELCREERGPADYLALSRAFHAVLLDDIPKLGPAERKEAKRFITLIDELYEHKVKLVCSAAALPNELYSEGDGAFSFERTASRLVEMQSTDYLAARHIED